jgi:hypothetical protein
MSAGANKIFPKEKNRIIIYICHTTTDLSRSKEIRSYRTVWELDEHKKQVAHLGEILRLQGRIKYIKTPEMRELLFLARIIFEDFKIMQRC